jgi:hypothetical protein
MIEHAKYELDLLLKNCEDEEGLKMQKVINNDILEIIETFAKQGHSGMSANYAIRIIDKLLKYEPILPLTLKDDEFVEVADGVFQNKRDSRIFKQKDRFDGKPYNVYTQKILESKGE